MLKFEKIPFETHPSDRRGYELFKSELWYSQQVCNGCFSQVRTIGPVLEKRLGTSDNRLLNHGIPLTMHINEWYDRTETGSQEHTTWDDNKRFGTCFCLNCGSDCTGDHAHTSLQGLVPLVENIFRYTKRELDVEIDGTQLGREVRELKTVPSGRTTGYETEVMAIAFARSIEFTESEQQTTSQGHEATAD